MSDALNLVDPDWPQKPDNVVPLSYSDRVNLFGQFSYVPAPTVSSPETIKITDDWPSENIVTVHVDQLQGIVGAPITCEVQFNKVVARQFAKLWQDWDDAGLISNVLTWAGSWVPRFVRGSTTYLSNHAWGTAFDINAQWNTLGARPALEGQRGCVRDLVQLANENGFHWGGHGWPGQTRLDGMHFEIFKVIP